MRSRGSGRRVPLGVTTRLPVAFQRRLSVAFYGRADLVHRLDSRLPVANADVLTIHDVAPLRFADEGAWSRAATHGARAARAVITASEFAAAEIRATLGPAQVHVVPHGVGPEWFDAGPLSSYDRETLGLGERFVIYAGGSSQRKNLDALATAWRCHVGKHGEHVELLICGPPSQRKRELFAGLPACRVVGTVERQLLLRLVTSASAVIVPSLYEGFGLPILESMASGTVVVCARTSSLAEVAGDVGILCEPTASGLAEGLQSALCDPHDRRVEAGITRARKFTWGRAAARHAAIYHDLLQLGSNRTGRSQMANTQ